MRLVASVPLPAVSLAALALAGWSAAGVMTVEPVAPPNADIVQAVEPVAYREQVRVRHRSLPPHSVWRGTYVCNQGLASVTLTIDVDPAGVATARYDFGPVPSNPTVPKTGAFILTGSLQHPGGRGFTGELVPTKWIVHPDNYFMVPLSIHSADGRHMRGRIHHDSCSQFETRRVE